MFAGAPPARFQVEIYSQGDLQQLATRLDRRLDILDAPHLEEIATLKEKREKVLVDLATVVCQIPPKRAEIDGIERELTGYGAAKQRLDELHKGKPSIPAHLKIAREEHDARDVLRQRAVEGVEIVAARLVPLTTDESLRDDLKALEKLVLDLEPLGKPAQDLVDCFRAAVKVLRPATMLDMSKLDEADWPLTRAFAALDAPYHELVGKETSVRTWTIHEGEARKRVATLDARKRALVEAKNELDRLIKRRLELRARVAEFSGAISEIREGEVVEIRKAAPNGVTLNLVRGGGRDTFHAALTDIIGGSRLRAQDELVKLMAGAFDPHEISALVEDFDGVTRLESRGSADIQKLVAYLSSQDLSPIETVVIDDVLEIHFDGHPVERVSPGQKALALLPLVLRHGNAPLILDQPEDDVDAGYLADFLAVRLAALKRKRQVIVVTHDANVVVLGGADKVVCLSASEGRTTLVDGSVDERKDDIVRLLEGGEEAFRARGARYGYDLAESDIPF